MGLAILAFLRSRKGGSGKGKAVAAAILAVLAAVTTVGTQAMFVAAVDEVATEISQELESADEAAVVELGAVTYDGFGTTLDVTITNGGDETLTGGLVTIQAVDSEGNVVEESFASVPQLSPGQSASEQVLFIEDVTSGVEFVVVVKDGFTF